MTSRIGNLRGILAATSQKIKLFHAEIEDDVEKSLNSEEQFDVEEFWKRLIQGSTVVSNEATKISMSFGGDDQQLPDANTCRHLCTALETACAFIVSICLRLPKEQGVTLRGRVRFAVRDIVDTAIRFVDNLQTIQNKRDGRHLQLTGCTWESCERIENLPRDNKAAVIAVISNNLELVNDAFSELHELMIADDEQNSEEKWPDSDLNIVTTCQGLLKVVQSCLKKAGEAVNARMEMDDFPPSALDCVAMAANGISPATDDFVSALYPPLCKKTVNETATALAESLKSLLATLSESGCFSSAGSEKPEPPSWMDFLLNAIAHNLKKVTDLTAKSGSCP